MTLAMWSRQAVRKCRLAPSGSSVLGKLFEEEHSKLGIAPQRDYLLEKSKRAAPK
jgi:hypothetical protein